MSPITLFCLLVFVATCGAFTVVGPESALDDDAPSTATCPSGTLALSCRCHEDEDCDGGMVSADAKSCTVYHRVQMPNPVRAVIQCAPTTLVVSSVGRTKNPTVFCPDHYQVANCMYHTPWKQDYPNAKVEEYGNGCTISDCNRCTVNVVCLLDI